MDFGKVDDPGKVDFTLPVDHPGTADVLKRSKGKSLDYAIGCAKWNKSDLKNFYPRGTKDELGYYSTQFNSIELNATFYRFFPADQFKKWHDNTPEGFRFFPKLTQDISHFKRLGPGTGELVDGYLEAARHLGKKLGCVFLQLINNFAPKDFDRVVSFVEYWPEDVPLAIEFRHTDWYNDASVANELYSLLEKHNVSNIITDTAGRRDLMHMRLTNARAFIRWTGANHKSDYTRLDEWVERIGAWKKQGLTELDFFVHQNIELESPLLSAHFIEKLNNDLKAGLHVPVMAPADPKKTAVKKTAEPRKKVFAPRAPKKAAAPTKTTAKKK